MKVFRFRLERVRQIRETQRRQSRAQFIETRRHLAGQLKRLTARQRQEQRAEDMYSDSARGETRSVNILNARHYLSVAEQQVFQQGENVTAAEQKVEQARLDLVEKTKNKEMLNRLRERRLAEHTVLSQREKQKQIDETARQNYFRNRKTVEQAH